jgi:hypothetical protein
MARAARVLLTAGVILLMAAGPALAQEDARTPVIDLSKFVPGFADTNGDGIPDIPVGTPGIWDEKVGATTPDEFITMVKPTEGMAGSDDPGSTLIGPCGGAVVSYDAEGNSLDAAVDFGDNQGPVDIYGEPAFTGSNPFRVDSGGQVAYYGFTTDAPGLTAGAFHNHRWEVRIAEVSTDNGGDPNVEDKNRSAGLVDFKLSGWMQFRAKLKIQGVMVDNWGPEILPAYSTTDLTAFDGREICFGSGWVEFVGDGYPLFTAPGALATALAATGFAGLLFSGRPALSWRA